MPKMVQYSLNVRRFPATHIDLQRQLTRRTPYALSSTEREAREKTDFLSYRNEDGLFAVFHSNRYLFITHLSRAGVSPKTAQTLARDCDIRLTMNVYTHIGLGDQMSAIGMLPAPPRLARVNGRLNSG